MKTEPGILAAYQLQLKDLYILTMIFEASKGTNVSNNIL